MYLIKYMDHWIIDGVLTYIQHYRDISECKSVCGGNRYQKCGGGFKNNIYKRKKGKDKNKFKYLNRIPFSYLYQKKYVSI